MWSACAVLNLSHIVLLWVPLTQLLSPLKLSPGDLLIPVLVIEVLTERNSAPSNGILSFSHCFTNTQKTLHWWCAQNSKAQWRAIISVNRSLWQLWKEGMKTSLIALGNQNTWLHQVLPSQVWKDLCSHFPVRPDVSIPGGPKLWSSAVCVWSEVAGFT